MNVRNFEPKDAPELALFWNNAAPAQGYAPLSFEQLNALILQNPHFDPQLAFVLEDGPLHGFACGTFGPDLVGGAERGYLSCVVVDDTAGQEGFGLLLSRLERSLSAAGCQTADVLFFNPIRLPWQIPHTPGHTHNNLPGLWVDCPAYGWMQTLGYIERARESAMYLALDHFQIPKALVDRQADLEKQNYFVDFYDPALHTGLQEMLTILGNPEWQQEITTCAQKGTPFLAALCGHQVVGFAGPVIPTPSGRGYFTGIGVIPAQEGHGLGTLLFYRLCEAEKAAGAQYLSLFTGEQNPARQIYEKAGFQTVRTFGILRKKL